MRGAPTSSVRTAIRFVLIGGLSTALYFALLLLLADTIRQTAMLTAVCYAVSMVANFLAQGLLTFRAIRLDTGTALRYAAMQGSALVANSVAMTALVDVAGIALLPAQIVVTALLSACVFLISRHWVYV